tara:strand:+ start:234 stop:395 length:162 start_codon:yes stop_codon:yes gene_type:complete
MPLDINEAKKGIIAKPTNSVVIISLNLLTRFSEITGNLFLLKGIAHNMYEIVG